LGIYRLIIVVGNWDSNIGEIHGEQYASIYTVNFWVCFDDASCAKRAGSGVRREF
jgi:hypothetical protein